MTQELYNKALGLQGKLRELSKAKDVLMKKDVKLESDSGTRAWLLPELKEQIKGLVEAEYDKVLAEFKKL